MDHRRRKLRSTTTRQRHGYEGMSNQGTGGGGSSYDADAQAYFTTASITDTTEKNAANTLIVAIKSASIWTLLTRLYLISPTSLAAALVCAKTLTTATAVNSPSHSVNGLDFTAASAQYVNTGLQFDTTNFIPHNLHQSIYVANLANVISQYRCGMRSGGASPIRAAWHIRLETTQRSAYGLVGGIGEAVIATNADGMYISNVASSTSNRISLNDSTIGTSATTTSAHVDTTTNYPYGSGWTVASTPTNYSTGRFKAVTLGQSLSTGQQTSLYNAMLAYQTALGRN